eukprot:15472518-Alexandrium_andersonii.AAC.1
MARVRRVERDPEESQMGSGESLTDSEFGRGSRASSDSTAAEQCRAEQSRAEPSRAKPSRAEQ